MDVCVGNSQKKPRGKRPLTDTSVDNYWQTVEKKSRGSRLRMDGSVCWLLLATFGKKLRGRREEVADVCNFWKKSRGRRLPMDVSVSNYWQIFEKRCVCPLATFGKQTKWEEEGDRQWKHVLATVSNLQKIVEREEGRGHQCRQLLKKGKRKDAADGCVCLLATVGNF